MDIKISELEMECDKLRNRLSSHEDLQSQVLMLKEELETSLESHKKLQEVALAFEEENRTIQGKYTEQLKDKSKLDAEKNTLESEVEIKKVSYEQLERKYNRMKDKIELIQEMEDQVFNLENEKRKHLEKINELEESLNASYEDSDARNKELQDKIDKLARENTEVNSKLVTYIEEVEDMDSKMEQLEKENEVLKTNMEKLKETDMFGTHLEQIEELENEKQELIKKLAKEKKKREETENELFRTEEELELFLSREEARDQENKNNHNNNNNNNKNNDKKEKNIKDMSETDHNNNESGISESSSNSSSTDSLHEIDKRGSSLDENSKRMIVESQLMVQTLTNEKNLLLEKITSLEEELDVLLEENAMLAKANNDLQQNKTKGQEAFETQILQLQDKIHELEEEKRLLEQEKFKRIVSSAEKNYECEQKQKEEEKENERLKNELKAAQDDLGVSNTKNSELQVEIDRKERESQERLDSVKEELKTELKSLKVALEEGTFAKLEEKSKSLEEERNKFLGQMETNIGQMKDEYEKKITHQNSTISNLEEEIAILRAMYENKSISVASSTSTPPVVISNGKCCSMVDIRSYREDTILENGLAHRIGPALGSDNTLNGYTHGDDQSVGRNGLSLASNHRTHGDGNSFRNGNLLLRSGHYYESDMDSDGGDCLSEREMRRISYKVAEGTWKILSCKAPINQINLNHILNSSANEQEKVYQLLHCWTNESFISRTDLLKKLVEYIDPNRKDVIKFLREMSGGSMKDRNSIKMRLKKFGKFGGSRR